MSTIGDLLLLTTTYKDPSHRNLHQITVAVAKADKELLEALVEKLNLYSDAKVTTSSLSRTLLLFAIEALSMREILSEADPLCVLPDTSTAIGKVRALGEMSDILGLDSSQLSRIDNNAKGSVIWK